MLSNNSIFVAVPVVMVAEQRDTVFALGVAYDTVMVLFSRLYAAASGAVQGEELVCDRVLRLSMFSDAWTIVDTVARVRRLLRSLSPSLSETEAAFFEATDSIRLVRNRLQHLDDFVGTEKYVAEKHALLGSIVWYDARLPATTTVLISCGMVSDRGITGGPAIGTPGDCLYPVDHISLRAFDLNVSISALVVAVRGLFARLEAAIVAEFTLQLTSAGGSLSEFDDRVPADPQGFLRVFVE